MSSELQAINLEGPVKKTGRLSVCAGILSLLFVGCYSSSVIDVEAGDADSIDPEQIDYVLLKDATKVEFDTTPVIAQDAIVGLSDGQRVTIPLSEVSIVQMRKTFDGTTTLLGGVIVGLVGLAVIVAVSGQ
jgi:hypothetical protein